MDFQNSYRHPYFQEWVFQIVNSGKISERYPGFFFTKLSNPEGSGTGNL